MAITFPTSPSNGDTITSGDVTWTYDGEKWKHNIRGTAGVAYSVSADSGSTDSIEIGVDTLNIEGGTGINTVVSNNNVKVDLANTAVTPGTYGSTSNVPTITVDQQGRITGLGVASNIPVEGVGVTDAITDAANIVSGVQYSIFELGTTNFPTTFGATEDTAGSFTVNEYYIISSAGDTNWATVGASVTAGNEVGVLFRAVGAGSGTGKAIKRIFTASSNGSGSSGSGKVKENVAHFPVFVDARSGTPLLQTSAGFTFFPSLDKITASNLDGDFAGTFRGEFAGTFFGALDSSVTGNVPSASEIVISNVEDANTDNFILFAEATSGTKGLVADSSLKYSPRTDTITVDNFSGSASKSLAVDVFGNSVTGTLKPVFTTADTSSPTTNATSATGEGQATWYNSTNNKIVLVYINNSGGTPALETSIGTPSTTTRTISWATAVDSTFDPATGANIAISTIDSNRFLLTFKENSTNYLKSVVGTYDTSANSVSFGTPTTIVSSAVGTVIRAARDTSSGSSAASRFKTVIAYTKGTNLHARALTIHNGTNALTLGTETSALNDQAVTTTRPVFDLVHYGLEEAWLLVGSETSTNNFFRVLNTASSGPNNVNITANTGQSFLGSGIDVDINLRVIEGVRNNTTTHNSVVVVYNSGSDIKAKIIYIGNTPGQYSVAGTDAKTEQTVVTGKTATSMTLALDSTNREVFLFASTSDSKGKVSRGVLSADSDGFLTDASWKPFSEVITNNTSIGGYNVVYDTLSKQWVWTSSRPSEVVKYNLVTLGAGLLETAEGFTFDSSSNTLTVGALSTTNVSIGGGGDGNIDNTIIGANQPKTGSFTTLTAGTSLVIQGTLLPQNATKAIGASGTDGSGNQRQFKELYLADNSAIKFGNDGDVTLTHTPDTGLTTNLAFTAGAITGTSFVIGNASISEAELEILDGAEVSTIELNKLNGATLTTVELNLLNTAAVGTVTNSKAVIYGANGEVNATTLQISGTSITADAGELNALDLGSTAVGTAIASKAVVIDANKDYSGIRNFTADKFIGDVYSSNGSSKVLEAGTDGTDATFTGNVTGDVYASNGSSKILEAGTDGSDAALTGTATKWASTSTIELTGAVTGNANIQGGESSNVEIATTLGGTSSTISVGADSGTPQDVSFSASGSRLDIDGTSNEIEAAVSKAGEVVTVQLGLPNDVTIGNNLTVTGNLDVNGTVTTVDSTNTLIKDVLIELGNGRTDSLANDSGIVIERGVGSNAFIGFDESEGKFKVGTGSFTGASTGNLTIATGTLIANIEGTTEGTHKGDIKASDNTVIINHTDKTAALDVTGDLSGTADKAVAVTVTATNTSADYRMIFTHASDNTVTDGGIFKDSAGNLKYNPNTNILTSTNFAGNLTGNVTSSGTSTFSGTVNFNGATISNFAGDTSGTAAKANEIRTVTTDTDADHFISFVDSDNASNAYETLHTDETLKYNPHTGELTATSFTGSFSGASTTSQNVTITENSTEDGTHYITFVDGTTSNRSVEVDTDLRFNPKTNTISAGDGDLFIRGTVLDGSASRSTTVDVFSTDSTSSAHEIPFTTSTDSFPSTANLGSSSTSASPAIYYSATYNKYVAVFNVGMLLTTSIGTPATSAGSGTITWASSVTANDGSDIASRGHHPVSISELEGERFLIGFNQYSNHQPSVVIASFNGSNVSFTSKTSFFNDSSASASTVSRVKLARDLSDTTTNKTLVTYTTSPNTRIESRIITIDSSNNITLGTAFGSNTARVVFAPINGAQYSLDLFESNPDSHTVTFSAPSEGGTTATAAGGSQLWEPVDSQSYGNAGTYRLKNPGTSYFPMSNVGTGYRPGETISVTLGGTYSNTPSFSAAVLMNTVHDFDISWSGTADTWLIAIAEKRTSTTSTSETDSNGNNFVRVLKATGTTVSTSTGALGIRQDYMSQTNSTRSLKLLGNIDYTSTVNNFGLLAYNENTGSAFKYRTILASKTAATNTLGTTKEIESSSHDRTILTQDPVTKQILLLAPRSNNTSFIFKKGARVGTDVRWKPSTIVSSASETVNAPALGYNSVYKEYVLSTSLGTTNSQATPRYQIFTFADGILESDSTLTFNPSTNALTAGSFIKSDASGSAVLIGDGTTVNHGAAHVVSTIVSRDSSGDFSANEITSDLVGNLTGTTSRAKHFIPYADSTYDLGGTSVRWNHIYADAATITTVTGNVSGSSGSTTGNAATATDLSINATQELVIQTGNNATSTLANGSANYVLVSGGSGSAPTWSNNLTGVTAASATAADALSPGAKIHVDNASGGATFTGGSDLDLKNDVYAFMKKALLASADGGNAAHTGLSVSSDDANFAFDIETSSASSVGTTDDNNASASRFLTFVDSAEATQGLKTDAGLKYNPNSNELTAGILTDGTATITGGDFSGTDVTASGTVEYGSLSDGSITITAFVNESNMASNSATLVPTQQSVKAYVDSQTQNASDTVIGVAKFNADDFNVSSGNVSLKTMSGLTGQQYGTGTAIPVITVDTDGRITAAETVAVSAAAVELEVKADGAGARDVTVGQDHINFVSGEGIDVAIAADSADTNITISGEDATANANAASANKGIVSFSDKFTLSSGHVTALASNSVTNGMLAGSIAEGKLAGSIPNNKLANDSITITDGTNSTDRALGQTITFAAAAGLTVGESSGTVTYTPAVASAGASAAAATEGIASFHSNNFDVTTDGFVSLKNDGIVLGTNTSGDYVRSINPGTGLTGGEISGEGIQHTLNVGELTVSELAAGSLQLSSESFSNDDTSLMTSAAIEDKILSYGFTTNVGDITGVSAGDGLSGGGISGGVSLALDLNELTDATIDIVNDSFAFIDANATNGSRKESVADLLTAIAGDGINIDSTTKKLETPTPSFKVSTQSNAGGNALDVNSIGGTITSGNQTTLGFSGESDQLTTSYTGNTVKVAFVDDIVHSGSLTVQGNVTLGNATTDTVTIAGDLTVNGTTTTINTSTVEVEDGMIELAHSNSADSIDFGMYGQYTSSSQVKYSGLFRDAATDKWKFFKGLQTAPTTTVSEGSTGYATATIVADFEGNLTGDVYASNGTSKILEAGTDGTDATFTGAVTGTATNATNVEVTATNTTNNTYYIPFVSSSGTQTGFKALGSDTQLKYNPSSGVLESGNIKGNLEGNVQGNLVGNVTGNVTGSLTGGITGNSASASSLQTARNIQGTAFDGTSDIDLTEPIQDVVGAQFVTNATNRGISYTYQDSGNGAMDGTVTALYNGTAEKLGTTATTLAVKAHIIPDTNDAYDIGSATHKFRKIFVEEGQFAASTITVGTKTISSDSNGIIVGGDLTATNLTGTLTGNVTGTVTGAASSAATLTTPRNITIGSADHSFNGSADIDLTEAIQDVVGAMFSSNTETNITATYQDSDGTIDLVVTGGGGGGGGGTLTIGADSGSNDDVTVGTDTLTFTGGSGIDTTVSNNTITTALNTEAVQDIVGAMFSSNTETGITATYEDSDGTIDLVIGNSGSATTLETARNFTIGSTDHSFDGSADIDLTEALQDAVGAMVSGNTETGITVTYEDSDGTLDFAIGTLNQDTTGTAGGLSSAVTVALSGDLGGSATFTNAGDTATITATIGSDAVTSSKIADDAVTSDAIADNAVTLGTHTAGSYVATVAGTTNEIEVSGSGSETASVVVGLPNDVTIGNDLTVTGTLTAASIVNGSSNAGSITLTNGANNDISITPHGSGNVNIDADTVKVGASNEDVTITTNGTGDLTLSTNEGTNAGTIKLADGANGDIEVDPDGSGVLVLKGNATKGSGQIKLNCEQNSHGVIIKGPAHSAAATYTLVLPPNDGDPNQVLMTDGSGNLTWSDPPGTGIETLRQHGYLQVHSGAQRWYPNSASIIKKIVVRVNEAPTGSAINITINKVSGNTTTTTNMSVAAGATKAENTSPSLTLAYDDYITVDVTQIGSTHAGSDLQVIFTYTYT